jgi:putative ABC transport system permease protein
MKFRPLLRALFRRDAAERDLRDELQFHLEQETRANERAGLPPDEARARALRDFGGRTQVEEEVREAWGTQFFDQLRQDLGYGLRGLRRNPGFALVVVLTLALGIGANTAIFSVVQGVLLRPLPYERPHALVMLNQAAPKAGRPNLGFSVPDFMDFRERTRAFEGLAEYHSMWFILLGRPEPIRVQTAVVSDNFFDVLGVQPLLGRNFQPGEDQPGAPAVLMLSHGFWQRTFGGDPNVVGQVFEMNNRPHTVVGVLPPLPAFPNADDVFMPASACPFRGAPNTLTNRNGRIIANVIARLKDGVSPVAAAEDAQRVGLELSAEFPQNYPVEGGYRVEMQALERAFVGSTRAPLLVLLAMSGCVLLIACANVANLTLARLVRRDRELAVRAAMGAGQRRIVRQLVTENLLLALIGGSLGLALAAVALKALVAYASAFLPRADEIAINGPVLAFTLVVSLATGLLFGSRPRLPSGDQLAETLKDGTRGTGGAGNRLRALLVVSQVAISVPLLVGAGLAARSLYNLHQVEAGIDVSRVLAAPVSLNWSRYNDFTKRFGYWERAMNEAATLAGVEAVGVSGFEPLSGLVNMAMPFELDGRPVASGTVAPTATTIVVNESYFNVVGQPLLRGRTFTSADASGAPRAAIVNQSLASRHWAQDDPVGQRITTDGGRNWTTIIGVVANTRQQIDAEPVDEIYVPIRQSGGLLNGTIVVRTRGSPAALSAPLRDALKRADPQQPVTRIETLEEVRQNSLASPRLVATLLGLFAVLALVITAAGIGGVLAFTVSQRTQEIGIRMALGADRRTVLWMVLRQGLQLVGVGLGLGVLASFALAHLMETLLYGVPATDPLTFIAVVLALLLVACVACLLPARRATAINPIIALRAN